MESSCPIYIRNLIGVNLLAMSNQKRCYKGSVVKSVLTFNNWYSLYQGVKEKWFVVLLNTE